MVVKYRLHLLTLFLIGSFAISITCTTRFASCSFFKQCACKKGDKINKRRQKISIRPLFFIWITITIHNLKIFRSVIKKEEKEGGITIHVYPYHNFPILHKLSISEPEPQLKSHSLGSTLLGWGLGRTTTLPEGGETAIEEPQLRNCVWFLPHPREH